MHMLHPLLLQGSSYHLHVIRCRAVHRARDALHGSFVKFEAPVTYGYFITDYNFTTIL